MLILPLGKEGGSGFQLLTLLVILLCIMVFIFTFGGENYEWCAYYPKSYSPIFMLSSSFCHGDIVHIGGNLFFFFCFASSVEKSSSTIGYILCFLIFASITSVAYSISAKNNIPTIGLSGIVWGYMGMFLVIHPKSKVNCLVWYLFIIKKIEVPAFIFILAFLAFDIGASKHYIYSNVNYVAHFSGFAAGILTKLILWPLIKRKDLKKNRSLYQTNSKNNRW